MDKQIDFAKIERSAKRRKTALNTVVYVFLAVWALVVLFPFYWMVLTSIKSYSAYNSEFIPKLFTLSPTFQNYAEAFTHSSIDSKLLQICNVNTFCKTLITSLFRICLQLVMSHGEF